MWQRNANRLFVPRVSTNFGKRSFFYRGTMLWNSLPSTVVEATTLSSFKYLYFNYYKDVIIVVVFAFVYCFIVYCFILCYCVCLYVVSQGSTENQLCWVDSLLKYYDYNYKFSDKKSGQQLCKINVSFAMWVIHRNGILMCIIRLDHLAACYFHQCSGPPLAMQ